MSASEGSLGGPWGPGCSFLVPGNSKFQWPFKWPFKSLKGHLKGHSKTRLLEASRLTLVPFLVWLFELFDPKGAFLAVPGGLVYSSYGLDCLAHVRKVHGGSSAFTGCPRLTVQLVQMVSENNFLHAGSENVYRFLFSFSVWHCCSCCNVCAWVLCVFTPCGFFMNSLKCENVCVILYISI